MPERLPLRKISTSTAKELEAFISLYQDLKYVMRLTHEAVGLLNTKEQDAFLLQTYWSAALIAYRRAFNTGVRGKKAPTGDFGEYEGAPETHQYFLSQADKLIAHSVNPFEEVSVGVLVNSEGAVVGTGELAGKLIATSQEGFHELNQLAKIAASNVKRKIEETKVLLLEEVSKLSPEELLQIPIVRYTAPSPEQAGKGRKSTN